MRGMKVIEVERRMVLGIYHGYVFEFRGRVAAGMAYCLGVEGVQDIVRFTGFYQ
jgi:hypothetical protein